MKVALLEASHWHVPLYLDPLEALGIEVVAVSDAEQVQGEAVAARYGSRLYQSSQSSSNARKSILRSRSVGIRKCRRSQKR
jgi:hypothetical protein